MNVAQLTIEMAANVARLKTDMAAARNTVEGTMNSIKKAAGAAQTALGAIGVGLSAAAFTNWIKGAINAADEANKLSQKIGITVKEIGGLQLAFKQGGVDADTMQKALAKLNVGIASGDSAFKALGVSTKNTDGSLRSTSMVLADVADRFAGTQDGASKTAMAIDLFGKSGAALIPVLNAGGDSIREFQSLAEKLGLTLSSETAAAAEKFNDTLELIGMGSRGIANQVMAELLPTLQSLAGEFLNLMTQGGNLKGIADVISAGLKGLFTVAAVGIEIFRTLGNTIGATMAGIVAVGSGDFKGASTIIAELGKDVTTNWTNTLSSLDRLWNQTGNTAIEAAAKITKGSMSSAAAMDEAAKAAKKLAEEHTKAVIAANDLVASIRFETETMQMSNLEREIANNLLKLEKTGLEQNTEEYRAYAEAIRLATIENEGIKQRIKLEKDAADQRKKIEEDYAKEVEQINFQIGQSLTDALINGGVTAKEFLINMFKTLILRPILQPIITGGTSAVMSLLGMSGTANASTGGASGSLLSTSNLGSMASMASSVNNAYTALTTTTLGALDSIAAGAQAATFAIGEGLSAMGMETAGSAVFSSAGTVGLAAQGVAGVAAGTMAGEWISDGKSVIGGNSLYTTAGGAAAGAAIGTMILPGIGSFVGGLIGGIVGGIVNAGWGTGAKQVTGQVLAGTWTPTGVEGAAQYATWEKKGGWFGGGGSGRDYIGMNAELEAYLDNAVQMVANASTGYAEILGLNAEAIAGISHYFEIPANSAEEVAKYLEGELKAYSDQLAQAYLAGTDFQRSGETAGETLSRLATSLSNVNSMFDTLGLKLFETSLAGGNVASAFIDMMGGFESFTSTMDFYYQNFYTQAERTAKSTENLTELFKAMGVELPANAAMFRQMVEAARAGGNEVLLANLLKLAPAFLQISQSADAAATQMAQAAAAILSERQALMQELWQLTGNTTALRESETKSTDEYNQALRNHISAVKDAQAAYASAQRATDAALETLRRVIDKQKSAVEENKNTVQTSISNLTSLFDYLKGQIKDLYASTGDASEQALANAWQYINGLVSTGGIPDQDVLSSAVGTIRQSLTESTYKTAFELQRDRMLLAGSLEKVAFKVGDQLSTEEMQLEALNDQINKLDEIYQKAVDQVNEARGIKTSVDDAAMTIESALAYLGSTLAAEISALGSLTSMGTSFPSESDWRKEQITGIYQSVLDRAPDVAGLEYWAGTNLTTAEITNAIENSVENRQQEIARMYENILGRSADISGLNYWTGTSLSLAGIESAIKATEEASLRGFASGGYYSGGLAMVGENGPELINFNDPGMVYNANQTSRILTGGDDVVVEIRNLREENQIQSRALVNLQNRMTRLLERWDGDGLPEERMVTA